MRKQLLSRSRQPTAKQTHICQGPESRSGASLLVRYATPVSSVDVIDRGLGPLLSKVIGQHNAWWLPRSEFHTLMSLRQGLLVRIPSKRSKRRSRELRCSCGVGTGHFSGRAGSRRPLLCDRVSELNKLGWHRLPFMTWTFIHSRSAFRLPSGTVAVQTCTLHRPLCACTWLADGFA